MKPLVGVDLDGVLADIDSEFFRISRKYLSKPKKGFVHSTYRYEDTGVWTQKEADYIWLKVRHTRNFWMQLPKLHATNELMRRQKDFNYIFLTARISTDGMSVAEQTAEWLNLNYAIRDALVIVADKKGLAAKELGLEYFIDDKKENCLDVKKHCRGCSVAVLDRTYNRGWDSEASGVVRAPSVNEWLRGISTSQLGKVSLDTEGAGGTARPKTVRLR